MQPTAGSPVPRHIPPVIVAAQFAATSLWFAGNAVMPDLQGRAGFPADESGPAAARARGVKLGRQHSGLQTRRPTD